jgi:hypothetical protein
MNEGNNQQMDDDEDEDEEEEENGGSPDDGNHNGRGDNMNGAGMNADDYEEIDYKICGELGKKGWILIV